MKRDVSRGLKKTLIKVLQAVVTIAAAIWIIRGVDWGTLQSRIGEVNVPWLILSIGVATVSIFPLALRWTAVMRSSGYSVPFWAAVKWTVIGFFFNSFLPTGKGGDVVRGTMIARRHDLSIAGVLGTVFVERVIGLVWTLVVAAIAWSLYAPSDAPEVARETGIYWGIAGILFAIAVIVSPRFERLVTAIAKRIPVAAIQSGIPKMFSVLRECRSKPALLLLVSAYSLTGMALVIATSYCVGSSIQDFGAPLEAHLLMVPLSFLVALLPSIGGYGVRELTFIVVLGWFGVEPEAALLFGLLKIPMRLPAQLFGGVMFLLDKGKKPRR